jgi:predicted regulator of Ras-like GTPase activity (Roadblock/LC7/MglB family)
MSNDKYEDVLLAVEAQLSGFIGASVVEMETGMPLATVNRRPDFDLDIASAYNSEMVKAKLNTMRVLNINSGLEDMLITLGDQLHLIKMVGPSTFMYVAVDRANSNLALLRSAVIREIAPLL